MTQEVEGDSPLKDGTSVLNGKMELAHGFL